MKLCILIPAYKPGEALLELVSELTNSAEAAAIVVVNDGSGEAFAPLFAALEEMPGVTVLHHAINMGKGAALKTGLNYCAYHFAPDAIVVTADADGQHLPEDILSVARESMANPEALVLGSRRFDGAVPLRSRIGNTVTRHVMRLAIGCTLTDTQTGLRGIPLSLARRLLKIPSNGYEFELDMLVLARQIGIPIRETSIRTVYIDGNRSSHFDPLLDSMRIYFVLLRFGLTSLVTAAVDYSVFVTMFAATESIVQSQVMARAIALVFNYIAVKRLVFYSDQRHHIVFPRYLLVVAISGTVSYACIRLLMDYAPVNVLGAKLLAETVIFIANFAVLREFIFVRRTPETECRP
jgi:glycosyltransferase involved in cell wall biosynthesis